jgi:HK97 family phage portal protein
MPVSAQGISEFIGASGPLVGGVHVNEQSALGLPAVWRSVSLVAGTCAAIPLHPYRKAPDSRVPLTSGFVYDLLEKPHPDIPPYEFWELVYAHRLLWGNAYLRTLKNNAGVIKELWPIHPARVRVGRGSIGQYNEVGQKVYLVDGTEPYGDDAILHLPGFGYDGICGVGPVRIMRQAFALGMAAEEFGARFFANGTLATGILQTEQRLDQEAADALLSKWRSKRAGLDKSHDVLILDSGAKFEQLTIPPDDAQFLQTRTFQTGEVERMFGVPPFLMFDTEKTTSWGTGLEQQMTGWVKFDLNRYYTPVEQRLSRVLGTSTQYVRYNVEGLLRGDSATRSEFYRKLWEMGVLSTNEIRELEERDRVDGGDMRYRPLNMGELGTADEAAGNPPPPQPTRTAPAPAPAPETAPEESPDEPRTPTLSHS